MQDVHLHQVPRLLTLEAHRARAAPKGDARGGHVVARRHEPAHRAVGLLAQVEDGRLSLGHAKLLAGLPQPMQRRLADETIHKGLSVRAPERRIRALNGAPERRSDAHSRRDADIVRLEQRVGEIVGAEDRGRP